MYNTLPWSIETATNRIETLKKRLTMNAPELQNVFTQTFFSTIDSQVIAAQKVLDSPLKGALV